MMELVIILLLAAVAFWLFKIAPKSKPQIESSFTRQDIADVSIITLHGSELRHGNSWANDQYQSVIVSLHTEGDGLAITRFGQVGRSDRFVAGSSMEITEKIRFEVKSKIYPNSIRTFNPGSNGSGGSFSYNRQDIQGAHIIAMQETGHISSVVGFPYPNGDESAANVLANLRLALAEHQSAHALERGDQGQPSNTQADGFDL